MGSLYAVIYVAGFAGILAIIGILQVMHMIEDGEVAPRRTWKWFVICAAAWPILAGLFILIGLLALVIPSPKFMPHQVNRPFMKRRKFAFTVKIDGEDWDCYHFWANDGKLGTLGFTKRAGKFVIGLMSAGHLNEDDARKRLQESRNKEAN
jgi:MFS family permease